MDAAALTVSYAALRHSATPAVRRMMALRAPALPLARAAAPAPAAAASKSATRPQSHLCTLCGAFSARSRQNPLRRRAGAGAAARHRAVRTRAAPLAVASALLDVLDATTMAAALTGWALTGWMCPRS